MHEHAAISRKKHFIVNRQIIDIALALVLERFNHHDFVPGKVSLCKPFKSREYFLYSRDVSAKRTITRGNEACGLRQHFIRSISLLTDIERRAKRRNIMLHRLAQK